MTIKQLAKESEHLEHKYIITPEVYYSFQQCSKDFNPLHTDEEFAKSKGFKSPIMYGNILNAFLSHFIGMVLPTSEVIIQSQDISFHKPVFLNETIVIESSVDSISEAVSIIIYKIKFKRLSEEKTELVAKGHVQIGLLK